MSRVRDRSGVGDIKTVRERAAACKHAHSVALGDAFTIATAVEKDAVAYCGAADDFDGIDVTVRRFRDAGV